MEQIDLWGNSNPVTETEPKTRRRYKTMQETHGFTEGQKCKQCKHLLVRQYANKYYKCRLWRVTDSASTDIRINKTACGKFEPREGAGA